MARGGARPGAGRPAGKSPNTSPVNACARTRAKDRRKSKTVAGRQGRVDYARSNGSTVYHASCSCMMGNHGMSVVDDQLRVNG
jgi:choline dehydrogenase-like flavoprotein